MEPDRSELWTLHKHATDDRNFQVTINWDRTKHYTLVNAAVFSVAGALSRSGNHFWGWLFVFAAVHSFFGAYSIWKGHQYYRAARHRLVEVERQLGLGELASKTTPGTVREATTAPRRGRDLLTVTNLQIVLQAVIGGASFVAALYVLR